MPPQTIGESVSIIVADVSFISLELILEPAFAVAEPGCEVVMLVKPQFEVGMGGAKGGVVRDPVVRSQSIQR